MCVRVHEYPADILGSQMSTSRSGTFCTSWTGYDEIQEVRLHLVM